jgi:hypothetical protein
MSHWAAGELRIGREYLDEGMRFAKEVLGAQFDMTGMGCEMRFG